MVRVSDPVCYYPGSEDLTRIWFRSSGKDRLSMLFKCKFHLKNVTSEKNNLNPIIYGAFFSVVKKVCQI